MVVHCIANAHASAAQQDPACSAYYCRQQHPSSGSGTKGVLLCPQPDGNCLYRAVEDQLAPEAGGANSDTGHEQLRARAADYMRAHEKEFAPFVLPVRVGGAMRHSICPWECE